MIFSPRSILRAVPLLTLILLSGCATIQVVRHHPQQERLERLLAPILSHAAHPQTYYWIRVLQPKNGSPDLWILHDGHLYFSASLVNQADDKVLTALLAHGVAHYELRHHTKREVARDVGVMASAIGGIFLPGLQAIPLVTDPMTERFMSAGQEFTADARTVTYLNSLGYSVDDYAHALQFLATHAYRERTGGIMTTQEGFSLRIATLMKNKNRPLFSLFSTRNTQAGRRPRNLLY